MKIIQFETNNKTNCLDLKNQYADQSSPTKHEIYQIKKKCIFSFV